MVVSMAKPKAANEKNVNARVPIEGRVGVMPQLCAGAYEVTAPQHTHARTPLTLMPAQMKHAHVPMLPRTVPEPSYSPALLKSATHPTSPSPLSTGRTPTPCVSAHMQASPPASQPASRCLVPMLPQHPCAPLSMPPPSLCHPRECLPPTPQSQTHRPLHAMVPPPDLHEPLDGLPQERHPHAPRHLSSCQYRKSDGQ